jgi:hypothetical protein
MTTRSNRNIVNRLCLPRLISVLFLALLTMGLPGCSGGSGGGGAGVGTGGGTQPFAFVTVEFTMKDVTSSPVSGALVIVAAAGVNYQVTTDANGLAEFPDVPTGSATFSIEAAGFEAQSGVITITGESKRDHWAFTLNANGAWAVGRAIVLDTQMVSRESDGSAMTFSVDVAVIDENSDALLTLTGADFSVSTFDCIWGGPRDCASDAEGNATGSDGNFSADGGAQGFGLQPPSLRLPYRVGMLVERSNGVNDWDERTPALRSFFTTLGGNDAASLASFQTENGATTLSVLGPYTNDGSIYLDAIDQLATAAGDAPAIQASLVDEIRRAAADTGAIPGVERTLLAMATTDLSVADIAVATTLARQLGVRISTVTTSNDYYGLSQLAVRTGGFTVYTSDHRQMGMVFGAVDQALAGTMPYYHMEFRLTGIAGTFVAGGNAKVWITIDVPTSIPTRGVYTTLDVALD